MDEKSNKAFWNRFAGLYDFIIRKDKAAYAMMIDQIKEELNRDMNALELATGTGLIALQVAPYCKKLEATDFSEKMIKAANQKECPENLSFSVQDATGLSYEGKFSLSFCGGKKVLMVVRKANFGNNRKSP